MKAGTAGEMKSEIEVVDMGKIPGQMELFEFLETKHMALPEDIVQIKGVIDTDRLTDFIVASTYRDIFLIINALDDYAKILKQIGAQKNAFADYTIKQFERISLELAEQIGLNKEKMYKKCQKKSEKSDIGEDAFALTFK